MWSQGLLGAHIAMIPKVDGGFTLLGQRSLSVLPVVYGLWASLRLGHLREWVERWLSVSVYNLGNFFLQWKPGSLLFWILKKIFLGLVVINCMLMYADVIKSFSTVDRSVLDCAVGRLGLSD